MVSKCRCRVSKDAFPQVSEMNRILHYVGFGMLAAANAVCPGAELNRSTVTTHKRMETVNTAIL